jgi:hypothetical protein
MLRVIRKEDALVTETQEKNAKAYDAFEPFRAMRDAYLDAMAKATVEAVNTEAYAEATGAMLEGYLKTTAPFREALDKSMLQALQQLELPSRQEVAALAERFTNIEMRLDDIDAKLDAIGAMVRQSGATREAQEGEPSGVTASESKPEKAGSKSVAKRPGAKRTPPRRRASRSSR